MKFPKQFNWAITILFLVSALSAQDGQRKGGGKGGQDRGDRPKATFQTDVPAHPWDIVLGRPTRSSVTLSILAYSDIEGFISYGTDKAALSQKTNSTSFKKGIPSEIQLTGLSPNTRYFYVFRSRSTDSKEFTASDAFSFTTARPAGADFVFAIQADSHLDEGTDVGTYERSLGNILAAKPDFLIDLGDTFMCDKRGEAYRESLSQYIAQRYYFGLVGNSVPVFLTLGNHDGEAGWRKGGGDDIFSFSNTNRRMYFPNPVPDGFYSGSSAPFGRVGLLQNYYAWEWGDALFIVLDPFTYTSAKPRAEENWGWTLGKEQYEWLRTTLEKSQAKSKFVFIHHLVGGGDPQARGGSEASQYFEWGGKDFDGTDSFKSRRPGFEMPIHELLVKYKVSAVFHGHDHLYVKQERDGIIYQEVPQPGHRRADNTRTGGEYGYKSGVLKGSSGVLVVRVSGGSATVSYVRAFPDERQAAGRKNGFVDDEYTIRR